MKRTERCFLALRWFIHARYGAVAGILLAWLAGRFLLGSYLAFAPVLLVSGLLLTANALFHRYWWLQALRNMPPGFSFIHRLSRAQIVVDLTSLLTLIHYYGGIENPFALLFFWHIIISCFFEQSANSFKVFLLASASYLGLIWAEFLGLLPHHALPGLDSPLVYDDPIWVSASSVAFLFSGAVLWFLTSALSTRVQRRESELELLSAELARINEELRRTQELKEGFFRTVAHEMKRPITATIQLLDAVRSVYGPTLDPKALEFVTRAQTRAESSFSLIKDLIQFARLESVQESASIVRPASSSQVQLLVDEYRPMADRAGVSIREETIPTAWSLNLEESDFALVLSNLISNAIRYSKSGGTVTVRSAVSGPLFVLEVADQGIGIAPEEQRNLFREFYRSSEAKRHSSDGSGLGLAIVKRIVDRYSGTISCISSPGMGTTFTVTLPLLAEAAQTPVSIAP